MNETHIEHPSFLSGIDKQSEIDTEILNPLTNRSKEDPMSIEKMSLPQTSANTTANTTLMEIMGKDKEMYEDV